MKTEKSTMTKNSKTNKISGTERQISVKRTTMESEKEWKTMVEDSIKSTDLDYKKPLKSVNIKKEKIPATRWALRGLRCTTKPY